MEMPSPGDLHVLLSFELCLLEILYYLNIFLLCLGDGKTERREKERERESERITDIFHKLILWDLIQT